MREQDMNELLAVAKPARYTNGEVNAVHKDPSACDLKVCFCFPDIYEIGMSHLGLRLLYDVANRRPDVCAERVFSPWLDREARLRASGQPLVSLESATPLAEFHLLGFSLQYELGYTNVLNILDLAGLPLESRERNHSHPLVIAGGPACLNPEPMSDFIDVFVIGEGEEVVPEILDLLQTLRQNGTSDRIKVLRSLSALEGVYVPSLVRMGKDRRLIHISGDPVNIHKRYVKDLEKVWELSSWIVPYIEIVHDRIGLEIMRGCPNHCRFCQARSAFFPMRILSAQKIIDSARKLYRLTGYEEISLLSLSSADHPQIQEITRSLLAEFKKEGVSLSLPSLRAQCLVGELSEIISETKKTSLTFAPEAGSERLRLMLRKNLRLEELFDVAGKAYASGYRLLKLYFMIGLPSETEEDLSLIADLCGELSGLKKKMDGHSAMINVSVSGFIPRPHTAFQWEAMSTLEELKEKQRLLRGYFRRTPGPLKLKMHQPESSFLEGILARGDRKLGRVILGAFRRGARFDAWDNHLNLSLWLDSFSELGLDPCGYSGGLSLDEALPWDFIDVGIPKQAFIREREDAFRAVSS